MEKIDNDLNVLCAQFEKSPNVWFFVDVRYRILHYNERARTNSVLFHNKKIKAGDSILDYARDTKNKVDGDFITCFGRAASGQVIERNQQITFDGHDAWFRTTYIPVLKDSHLEGISIEVEDITHIMAREK